MNGEVCCILSICCPPERAKKSLAKEVFKALKSKRDSATMADADAVAEFIIDNFDLAPKGLLTPLLVKAGELARAHPDDAA